MQIFVKTIANNNKTIVNIPPEIPAKTGDKTVFKKAVIPVASFVKTLPSKIAEVQSKVFPHNFI